MLESLEKFSWKILNKRNQMTLIRLGTEFFSGKPCYFNSQTIGTHTIAAISRYGKSSLIKNIACQIAKHKLCVFFDFYGEEYSGLKYPNFFSNTPLSIPKIQTFTRDQFGFFISDLEIGDWMSFGMTEKAALNLIQINKSVNDDPEKMIDIINELPEKKEDLPEFLSKYPSIELQHSIHSATVQSLRQSFNILLTNGFFINPRKVKTGEKLHGCTELWNYFLSRGKNLHISLDLSGNNEILAQFYVGKILRQMKNILSAYKPALFVDEADKVFPQPPIGKPDWAWPASLREGLEYLHKVQRRGLEMFVITQNPRRMHKDFLDFSLSRMFGQLEDFPETHGLRWDHESNYRQFMIETKGRFGRIIFVPDELCTFDVQRSYAPLKDTFRKTWRSRNRVLN